MHSKLHFKWLEDNNLLIYAKENYLHFKRILRECVKVYNREVLIITDHGYEGRSIAALMSAGYLLACKDLNLKVNLIVQAPKYRGDDAETQVIEALDNLRVGLVILCLSGRIGNLKGLGDSYRKFIKSRNHKFISAPSLGEIETSKYQFVIDSINVDYTELKMKCDKVKDILDKGSEIRVTTEAGTKLTIDIDGCQAISNSGIMEGSGGNIPAGETYIPPKGKTGTYGRVVIDATLSYKHGSWLLKHPVTLEIDKGEVVEISGDEGAVLLDHTLTWAEEKAKHPWGIRRIGEFGVGLNKGAKVIGATIVDEKAANTAHIALGSNSWFGGSIYAIIHLDQVFRNPNIFVDDKILDVNTIKLK